MFLLHLVIEESKVIKVNRLLHSTILVSDFSQAIDFYEGLLNFKMDHQRPDLGFAGRWYSLGEQQVHLMVLPDPEKKQNVQIDRPEHAGRDRHIAFEVDSVENLAKLLESNNIKFTMSRSGRKALFCRDPDGNGLEFVQFDLV